MMTAIRLEPGKALYEQTIRERVLRDDIAHLPGWLQSLHLQGMSRFDALGFPTHRNESWKYINLRELQNTPFKRFEGIVPASAVDVSPYELDVDGHANRLVFVNGQFNAALSTQNRIDGIEISDLRAAYDDGRQSQILQQHLGKMIDEEPDAFAALNTALFENGAFVSVPDNSATDELVQILYIHTAQQPESAVYPRNLFVVGKNAKLEILIQAIGPADQSYLVNCVNELIVDEGGELNVTLVQNDGAQGWHFTGTRATLQKDAKVALNTISLGAKTSRQSVRVLLKGENAECHLNGLNVLKDSTQVYHDTVIEHWEPRCISRQYYKGILDDQAKSEFAGTIFVAPEAQLTDSEQMNRNLVLSDDARVYSRPQLEINADDVKCAHGATVGQLEDEQLFYLASRGIDAETAESILTYGFAEEVVQRVPHKEVRQYIDRLVFANLHRTNEELMVQLAANEQ